MKKLYSVRTIILAGSLLLQLGTLCFQSHGAAGDLDLSFYPDLGVNGPVNAVVAQPDGKVIIGGAFTTVKGLARARVARLNTDGSGDSSFNAGMTIGSAAYAIVLQSDGKVLVGDDLGITRLNPDGSQDTNFNASIDSICGDEGCYRSVNSIAVQSDGKVLIGGYFYVLNGTNDNVGIARLNSNGSLDSTFNPGTGANYCYSVVLQPDGKVLTSGAFIENGTNRNGVARFNANGSRDSSFNHSAGVFGYVISVALQSDGKVLFGGSFTAVNGTNCNSIARLNANGSLDSSFIPRLEPDWDSPAVRSIVVQSDGKVLIGGYFTTVNGTNRNGIARLNANGSPDVSFNPGRGVTGSDDYPTVNSVVVQSDGKMFIGGNFTFVNGTNRNRIARLNTDGSLDGGFHPGRGLESPVSNLELQPDGKVLIDGGIRLNANGSVDNSYTFVQDTNFNPNLGVPGTDYSIPLCSAAQGDGKVFIGGYTYTAIYDSDGGYYPVYGYFLYRFNPDGSRDFSFEPALGDQSYYDIQTVQKLAVQPDGKVLVGGSFGSMKGTNRNGIARLNANGTMDSSFNPGFGGRVYSMLLQPDGRVLVGSGAGLAWLNSDGSRDPCFNPTIGFYGFPIILVLQPDGRVLVGGSFYTVNGVSRNRIARLNSNGSLDSSFDPGTGADAAVLAIALQPDGNVLIGGNFSAINGVVRPYVARLLGGSSGPQLRLFSATSNAVIIAWPSSSAGFTLQQNTNLDTPNWVNVAIVPATVGLENQVAISPPSGQRFFRLSANATNTPSPPPPPPVAPQLTATAGNARVSLSWTAFPGATGHHLQRATSYSGPYATIANPATANYTDMTAVNGTTYYYTVSVDYPCGQSAPSAPVGSTPYVPPPTVHVQSITMSWVVSSSRYRARAMVKVVDNAGIAVSGATVVGNFSGSINNAGRTGVTTANGNATITSTSSILNGTVTFTVVDIHTATMNYNSGANVVTSATITR